MIKTFEIRKQYSGECDKEINVVYVDGQPFDYLIDQDSLRKAALYCQENPGLKRAVHGDIQKHFLDCLGEFLGRPVTLAEVNTAIREGTICTS